MAPRRKAVVADAKAPPPDLPVGDQAPKPASKKRGAAKLEVGSGATTAAEAIPASAEPAAALAAMPKVPAVQSAPVPKRRRVISKSVFAASRPALDLFVFGSNPFGALGLGEDETVKYRPAAVEVEGVQFVQVSCCFMSRKHTET